MQELKKEKFKVAFEAEIINKRMRGYRPVRFNCPRKHYADQRKTTSFTLWGIERGGLELSIWLKKKKEVCARIPLDACVHTTYKIDLFAKRCIALHVYVQMKYERITINPK